MGPGRVAVAHSYFRLYIHLLRYIRTNLCMLPHLGYQEREEKRLEAYLLNSGQSTNGKG